MFDSLKSKLKNVSHKSEKLDSEKIYEEPKADVPQGQTPPEPEKVPEQAAPAVEEKPLSRREQIKLEKKKKAEAKAETHTPSTSGMVGDSGKKIKEDPLDDILDELEVALLESDVAYPVVQEIILGVRDNLVNKKYSREFTLEQVVETAVKESVRNVLKVNEFDFMKWIEDQPRPTVIMFIGINGTGKTTAIAKIANMLQKDGKTVVMAACDTFRAGAIEQLTVHADKLGVKIVKQSQDADPAAVGTTPSSMPDRKEDVVLIDTAGPYADEQQPHR